SALTTKNTQGGIAQFLGIALPVLGKLDDCVGDGHRCYIVAPPSPKGRDGDHNKSLFQWLGSGRAHSAGTTAALRDSDSVYVRFGSWSCENSGARATRRNISKQLHL